MQLALVLFGVDSAEFVSAGGIDVEVCSECLLLELVGDTLEERLLALGLNGVDYAEGETEQTVVVLVGDKGAGDGGGYLNGLPCRGDTTDVNLIKANSTRGTAAVTVRDVPGCTLIFLPSVALARVKSSVVATLA